jgi:hypothetical protein
MGLRAKAVAKRYWVENNFTVIYENNLWNSPSSRSGRGSTLAATKQLRRILPQILEKLQVRTMLDAPCGDFHWMGRVHLPLDQYIGVDVVRDLIKKNNKLHGDNNHRFLHRDIITDELPRADLVLCRDCIMHLPNEAITLALKNIKKSGADYLLITNHRGVQKNQDLEVAGGFRPVNLLLPPFSFPAPLMEIEEAKNRHLGQTLALWKLNDVMSGTKTASMRLVANNGPVTRRSNKSGR